MSESEATTYIHKFKCMSCGLHFACYSWNGSFPQDGGSVSCPECEGHKFLSWRETTNEFIFTFIPGDSIMTGFGVNRSEAPLETTYPN